MSLPKQLLKHTLDYATDIMDTLIDTIDKPPSPHMEFGNLKVFLEKNKCGYFKSIKFVDEEEEIYNIPKEGLKFRIYIQSNRHLYERQDLSSDTSSDDISLIYIADTGLTTYVKPAIETNT